MPAKIHFLIMKKWSLMKNMLNMYTKACPSTTYRLIMLPKGGNHIVAALSVHWVPCPANNFKTTGGI